MFPSLLVCRAFNNMLFPSDSSLFSTQVESVPKTNHGLVNNILGVVHSISDLFITALGKYTTNGGKYDLMHKAAECFFGEIHFIPRS